MSKYQLLPDLGDDDYARLKADIAARGVLVPIEKDEDGTTLDGHHRERICEELGITDYTTIVRIGLSEAEKRTHVRMLNLARRHLTQEQRRVLIEDHARENPQQSNVQIAEALNVDDKTVASVLNSLAPELIASEFPNLSTSIGKDGKVYPRKKPHRIEATGAVDQQAVLAGAKQIRRTVNDGLIDRLKARSVSVPEGLYRVIVIDPPWPMKKIERDVRPNQVGFDYPTMTIDEIKAYTMPASKAADDCHLFLWTTQKFLWAAKDVLDAWGFHHIFTMVWHKSGGFQPVGLAQYNCEFVLYARRGAPTFVDTTAFCTCFTAPRREHSRKPDEFYDVVRRVTAGPRIDMFSREPHEGFDQLGNEIERFAVDAAE